MSVTTSSRMVYHVDGTHKRKVLRKMMTHISCALFITCDELLACISSSTISDQAASCSGDADKSRAASAGHTLKQPRRSLDSVKKRQREEGRKGLVT